MFPQFSNFRPADPFVWQGRKDTLNPERFFECVTCAQQLSDLDDGSKTIFLGFASDTGIKRNLGREGAKLGPEQFKRQLAKLPCVDPLNSYVDLGTIYCDNDDLEAAQQQFAELVNWCHQQGHRTIGLGGGHEIAWAHYQGLAPLYPKLGIINFDAHFDLRPYTPGQPGTSGTPFAQIAAYCTANKRPFDYCCVGIQKMGNTPSLFQQAHSLKVSYLTAEDLQQQSQAWQMAFLDDFMLRVDYIYLTICLDVLAACYAPGVSAPQVLGVTPWQIIPLLKYIIRSGKVVSYDIAELAPPLDEEERTAKLAAQIIAELLHTN